MAEKNIKEAIKKIEAALEKYEKKTFKVMFFVIDSKGTPNGSLSYIYDTAYKLSQLGYKVQMLHAEKEFVGVEGWLGEKYANLPHLNIQKDNVDVSPADILFIPEVYANVMSQTKSLPCKRVAILQNFSYLTEIIPMGASWDDLQIRDCVTTSDGLANRLHEVFPEVQCRVVRPEISPIFKKGDKPKKLIINVIAKNSSDISAILKPFYWKYPIYKWVAFRDVKNLPKEDFAKALREGFATIWCDPFSDFGYSALEAMASGNIVIGRIPENEPDWMLKEDGSLRDNGVWFYNTRNAQDLIAGVIQSFISDSVPQNVYDEMEDTLSHYTHEINDKDIQEVYINGIFEQRKHELQTILSVMNKKLENKE